MKRSLVLVFAIGAAVVGLLLLGQLAAAMESAGFPPQMLPL